MTEIGGCLHPLVTQETQGKGHTEVIKSISEDDGWQDKEGNILEANYGGKFAILALETAVQT